MLVAWNEIQEIGLEMNFVLNKDWWGSRFNYLDALLERITEQPYPETIEGADQETIDHINDNMDKVRKILALKKTILEGEINLDIRNRLVDAFDNDNDRYIVAVALSHLNTGMHRDRKEIIRQYGTKLLEAIHS